MSINEDNIIDFGKHKGSKLCDVCMYHPKYLFFLAGYKVEGTQKIKLDTDAFKWITKNKKEYVEYAQKKLHRKCWLCLYRQNPRPSLVPIGDWRNNGNPNKTDWNNRHLHVDCWKYLKKREELGYDGFIQD